MGDGVALLEFHTKMNALDEGIDLVVSVCDNARETCPVFPRPVKRIHVGFRQPAQPHARRIEGGWVLASETAALSSSSKRTSTLCEGEAMSLSASGALRVTLRSNALELALERAGKVAMQSGSRTARPRRASPR